MTVLLTGSKNFFVTENLVLLLMECFQNGMMYITYGIYGISQVVVPLLFIIYVNDVPEVCTDFLTKILYTDDAKLYRLVSNSLDSDILQNEVNNIKIWADQWL